MASAKEAEALHCQGVDLHKVEFPYESTMVTGWFVRHGGQM